MWGMTRVAATEKAYLTSRSLPFDVRSVEARPPEDAVQAFAYRYGTGWQVVYVGRRVDHKIGTAIGYGATHRLVLEDGAADEAWLIDELRPPLNDGWR
jgi:hypothetical protein